MATTKRARPDPSRTDEQLAYRVVFRATWDFVWNALERYHLDDADRDDVTAAVVFKAWHKAKQFDAARGNEQQWLRAIARNEVANLFNARSGGAVLVPLTEVTIDCATEARSLEDDTTLRQTAERAFSFLEPSQAQVIVLRLMHGLPFREIAKKVGISPSTAQLRYQRGMEALRRAVDEGEIENPFSAAVAGVVGVAAIGVVPPRGMEERAWQHVMVVLGLDEGPPDSEPPASGTHRREPVAANDGEPPPSSHPPHERSPWPHRLGLALLLLLGPGSTLPRACEEPHDEPPATALAAMQATSIAPPTASADATSAATGALGVSPEAMTTTTPPAPTPPRRRPRHSTNAAERGMVDKVHAALLEEDVPGAFAELGNQARQFPRGEHVATRDAALSRVCALHRADPAQRDAAELEKQCAGR